MLPGNDKSALSLSGPNNADTLIYMSTVDTDNTVNDLTSTSMLTYS